MFLNDPDIDINCQHDGRYAITKTFAKHDIKHIPLPNMFEAIYTWY